MESDPGRLTKVSSNGPIIHQTMTRSTGRVRPALLAVQHTRSRTVGRALDQQPETEEYDLSADSSDTSSRSARALLRDTGGSTHSAKNFRKERKLELWPTPPAAVVSFGIGSLFE